MQSTTTNRRKDSTQATYQQFCERSPQTRLLVAGIRPIPPGVRRVFAFLLRRRILIITMSEMLDRLCFSASYDEEALPEIVFPRYSFEHVARTLGCDDPFILSEKSACIMRVNHRPDEYDDHLESFWRTIRSTIASHIDDNGETYHKIIQGLLLLQADISFQAGNIYHTHTSLTEAMQSFVISKDQQSVQYTQSALDYIHRPPIDLTAAYRSA